MMLMPDAPAPGRTKPVKGFADARSEGRKPPGRRIEEEHVAGTHLDGQRAAVEPALERLDLQHDAVVVEAVAAANDETAIGRVPGEADPRPEVVQIALPLVRDKRQHDRVELVDAALIVDLGVDLVAQAEIQLQPVRDCPVVLNEAGDVRVVGVGLDQRLIGLAAAERDGEQQVVVVDDAVAVVIERGEVLDELDAALLEDAEPELRVDALHLAAEPEAVGAADERGAVRDLQARLARLLRHAKRRAILHARERQLRRRRHRQRLVEERADAAAQRVDEVAARRGRP